MVEHGVKMISPMLESAGFSGKGGGKHMATTWPRVITYASVLGRMNTHVPPILMFTGGRGF